MICNFFLLSVLFLLGKVAQGKIICECSQCSDGCDQLESACEGIGGDATCSSDDTDDVDYECAIDCDQSGTKETACDVACTDCSQTNIREEDCGGKKKCFHESTTITYKGNHYSMQDLVDGKESECAVPHVVKSTGVRIETSCDRSLIVTESHLIATENGFVEAINLQYGDKLFVDADTTCHVASVTVESSSQTYFGLNCLDSVVQANDIKASTFGTYHALPAMYMKWAGNLLGVKMASLLGDRIASTYFDVISKRGLLFSPGISMEL